MSSAATARKQESLVDGEFLLTAADFRALAEELYATSGIHLPDSKAALVYSRLAKRLRALGLRNFEEYVALVRSPEGQEERERLLMALTTRALGLSTAAPLGPTRGCATGAVTSTAARATATTATSPAGGLASLRRPAPTTTPTSRTTPAPPRRRT